MEESLFESVVARDQVHFAVQEQFGPTGLLL